jgi:hypothetical protein
MSEDNRDDIEAEIAKAKAEVEERLKQEKDAVVAELIAERKRRQEAEELNKGKQDDGKEDDPEKVIEKVLERKQQESFKQIKESTIEAFKRKHPEFSPENDAAGLAFAKFQRELQKFNESSVRSKEEYEELLSDAYEFMNRKKRNDENPVPYYAGSNANLGSSPRADDNAGLNDAEKRLIASVGWTKEKFLDQKAKRPSYVASLLRNYQR